MTSPLRPIYLPPQLSESPELPLLEPTPDEIYVRMQIELIRATYSRSFVVTDPSTTHPAVPVFLQLFINLIDTMESNGPDAALVCMTALKNILNALYPTLVDATDDAAALGEVKVVKH